MNREAVWLRASFYAAFAACKLGDSSYAARWLGRAEAVPLAEYLEAFREIHTRLVAAGKLAPDEDLYEREIRMGAKEDR